MSGKRLAAGFLALTAVFATAASSNWNTRVERIDGAHVIGNPEAKQKLTEFVSYTCPHCGAFARTGDEALKLAYVGPGKMRLEVRHYVRDPIDLTVTLMTWCGSKAQFPRNHAAFMHTQPKWLDKASKATPAQQQRWYSGEWPARARAIAADLDFYAIMQGRGYARTQVDRCIGDLAMAEKLSNNSERDAEKYNIPGTPSFMLDGTLLAGVHTWPALEKRLTAPK